MGSVKNDRMFYADCSDIYRFDAIGHAHLEFVNYLVIRLLKRSRSIKRKKLNYQFFMHSPIFTLLSEIYGIDEVKLRTALVTHLDQTLFIPRKPRQSRTKPS